MGIDLRFRAPLQILLFFAFIIETLSRFSCAASNLALFRIYRETLSRFRAPLQILLFSHLS